MTDLQILSAVRDNGGSMEYTALLNLGLSYPNYDSLADKARIEKLIEDGYLRGQTQAYCTIALTEQGRLYLQQMQQAQDELRAQAAEKAKEKRRQHRHDWLIAIFSTVFGTILGVFGTLLVQWLT